MNRSGKIALWAGAGLAVVLLVFLIAIAVGQGLGQAGLWATVLGLPIGLIGAIAGVLALVLRPAAGHPGAGQEPPRPEHTPAAQGAAPATLARLATVGTRGQYLDAWALRKDGTVRHWWWPREDGSQSWSPPESFRGLPDGGGLITDIAATSRGPGHAEIFAVDRHGNLWHRCWQDKGWANWQKFDGHVAAPIAACSFADGHIQVFVTDPDNNAVRYQSSPAPARWDEWTSLDGLGGPEAAMPVRLATVGKREQYLDAWALRADGRLSHSWWPQEDKQAWSKPEDFAAPSGTVDIAAGSRGPGHAEIFAVDRHGNLWHRWWQDEGRWVDWQKFDGHVAAPVAACSSADGHIQVFVTDPLNGVIKYSSSSVPGSWDPWEVLG